MTVESGGWFSVTPLRAATAATCVVLIVSAGCACSANAAARFSSTTASAAAPRADLSPLTGGEGVFIADPLHIDLRRADYVQHECVAAGSASSYRAVGGMSQDGRWSFVPSGRSRYRTRVVVRLPATSSAFSGTVVIEWLNVSGGVDAHPEWANLHEEILRRGDAWVGVSAQRIGVMGGPVLVRVNVPGSSAAGKGLRVIDPARYGSLDHPGDGYSFDIFTQVARAVRRSACLGGLRPKRLIAAGQSQSAFALVTYYDGVQPLTHAFDGFFVHSRGAAGLPLVGPGASADIAGAIGGPPALFRTDQHAPVMDVQSESDITSVLNSYAARQPDNRRFRLWEVAGTAHADAHLLGSETRFIHCGAPINKGPMHVVVKAAFHALKSWVKTGKAPPVAGGIKVMTAATPQIVRNADGIALGGVRTPPVDVPVEALSGVPGPNPSTICLLLGSAKPLSASQLKRLYPSRAAYLRRFKAGADRAIKAGFVLPEDRSALVAFAQPSGIP